MYKSTEVDGVEYYIEEDGVRTIVLKKQNGQLVEVPLNRPRGEIGSLEVVTNQATASALAVPVTNAILPVLVKDRPVKTHVAVTFAATLADTLGGLVIYEDATVIGYMYLTVPKDTSYQTISKSFRRRPSPGWHVYQAYMANFTATGLFGIFSLDPTHIGLEIITEEI